MGFKVSFFCLIVFNSHQLFAYLHRNYSIFDARNTWVGNLVCLFVMVNMSCTKRWMVEVAIALKKGLHN